MAEFMDRVGPSFDWRPGDVAVLERVHEIDPDCGWWVNARTGDRQSWMFSRFRPLPENQP